MQCPGTWMYPFPYHGIIFKAYLKCATQAGLTFLYGLLNHYLHSFFRRILKSILNRNERKYLRYGKIQIGALSYFKYEKYVDFSGSHRNLFSIILSWEALVGMIQVSLSNKNIFFDQLIRIKEDTETIEFYEISFFFNLN